MKKIIAITAGDPNSINTEIIGKTWKILKKKYKKNIFIIGNYILIKKQLKLNKIKISIKKINSLSELSSSNILKIMDVPLNSNYVLNCIDLANSFAKKKIIYGFINCPINKKRVLKSQSLGITEYLAKKNQVFGSEVMMIYNKNLSVVPITTHLKLKNVSKNLKKHIIENKIKVLNNFYLNKLKRKPRIAVLGLNPHNDELRKNSEEVNMIIPVLKKLKKINKYITGPFPADTVFTNKKKLKYDAIVGMYHDQVLAPFKAIYNFDAVNVTLGLKYFRVSPDHGVAEDIANLKKANPLSLLRCVEFLNLN